MLPDFRIRQRDYLLETARSLTEELDLKKVLERIVRVAAELLAGRACLIALREDGNWRIVSSYGIRADFLKRVQRLLDDVPAQADSARFELPEVNRRLQRITETASMGLLASVGLPLIARDEVIGVIFIFRAYEGRFSSQDKQVLQAFASQAAIAVHNARLYTEITQQKQHLDAVVDSAGDGIFILDHLLLFSRFNRACSRMTGLEEREVLARPHAEVIRFRRRQPGPALDEARQSGWPHDAGSELYVEGDLERAGGGEVSVGITYAPVLAADGHLISIVANVRDITKFREAEELKSTFISVISHELRTPVALIKGYAGTLRRRDAQWDPDVVRDSLMVIEEEADHLTELIDDLLDTSRLQAGALELNLSEVSLDEMASHLADRFRTQTDAHTFEVQFPSDFPIILGDDARLTQVLSNLISNAVKFSEEGGRILIAGGIEAEGVVVCVQDEGPGIPVEDRPHIFDRFYRARDVAHRTQGTGLGLYLARAVVEAHGGTIWIDEEVTQGARICLSLPKAPPK